MTTFTSLFDGPLKGILRWPQWDTLRNQLATANDGGWFVYFVGEDLPAEPMKAPDFARFLDEIDRLLRNDHLESYLGIVYADDLSVPTFIKIYDPNNLGASCGSSGIRVLPGWVLSRIPPQPLTPPARNPARRRRWWQKLLSGGRPVAA